MSEPTSEQIEMTLKMVDKQKALKMLWGESYQEKMAPVIGMVKEIMAREKTKALPTVLTMIKALTKAGKISELREAALIVAAVEIIQGS